MRYTLPYLLFCAAVIALLVFLNSEQTFVLSQILHADQRSIGFMTSTLSLVDEVLTLVSAPFWGALSDKLGTRHVSVIGLCLLALGVFLYPHMHQFSLLITARAVFALGASAAVSMITASLSELSLISLEQRLRPPASGTSSAASISASSFDESEQTVPLFDESGQLVNEPLVALLVAPRPNGFLAGNVGFFSGLGALFSVAVLLPLPTHLGGSGTHGLVFAFEAVAAGTLLAALLFFFPLLYQNPTRGWRAFLSGGAEVSVFDEAAVDVEGTAMSYFELLHAGWSAAFEDARLGLGYSGSMCARATSVTLALLVPMWVNGWYYRHGLCHHGDPGGCHPAITQAAVLTGVANTVMLVAAPIVGHASNKLGAAFVMAVSGCVGIVGVFGFVLARSVHGVLPVLASSCLGFSQIGVLTASLSLTTDQRRVASGAIAGYYSFAGSLGIIAITLVGGVCYGLVGVVPFGALGVMLLVTVMQCATFLSSASSPRRLLRSSASEASLR